jgi:hypothetical protein
MALELSMAAPTPTLPTTTTTPTPTSAAPADPAAAAFLDSSFVSQLLESVDVDQNDPLFQAALAQINQAGGAKVPGEDKSGGEDDSANRKRKGDDGA